MLPITPQFGKPISPPEGTRAFYRHGNQMMVAHSNGSPTPQLFVGSVDSPQFQEFHLKRAPRGRKYIGELLGLDGPLRIGIEDRQITVQNGHLPVVFAPLIPRSRFIQTMQYHEDPIPEWKIKIERELSRWGITREAEATLKDQEPRIENTLRALNPGLSHRSHFLEALQKARLGGWKPDQLLGYSSYLKSILGTSLDKKCEITLAQFFSDLLHFGFLLGYTKQEHTKINPPLLVSANQYVLPDTYSRDEVRIGWKKAA